jgi:HlyD family secretion protein
VHAEVVVAQTGIEKAESRLERARRARQRLVEAQKANKTGATSSEILAELDIDDRIDAAEQAITREKAALEVAQSKQAVLSQYTRDKTIKALNVDLASKRIEELAKKASFELQVSKERKLDRQIAACKITAPASGTVVYANTPSLTGKLPQIEEGATVRQRQKILSVVDLNGATKVKLAVEESQIKKITRNLKAKIRIDAFPDQLFEGTVASVNALPNARLPNQGDSKVYTTWVRIHDKMPGLRPGMAASVEILVGERKNVISVPFQALFGYEGKVRAAIKKPDGAIEWRDVTPGASNDKWVEITHGISSGDVVILNPVPLLSDQERKLAVPWTTSPMRTR